MQHSRKKGRLKEQAAPSLGRKRPRRAAIARGATAPQQYAAALHKVQVLLSHFRCKKPQIRAPKQKSHTACLSRTFNNLDSKPQWPRYPQGPLLLISPIRDPAVLGKYTNAPADSVS